MSNKIVEDWVAKYGNNPEVDKIVNERVEYMSKKPHQRLLDGMPPHIAKKVDKMISEMKQLHDAATDYGWKTKTNTFSDPVKANELAESAKQDFIAGAKWMMEKQKQKQALVDIMDEDAKNGMYDQPDKIKVTVKKDSPAADIIKTAKEEKQAFKEAVEAGNSKQQTAVEWLIDKIAEKSIMEKDRYYIPYNSGTIDITDLIEQAKQMEKEQLENARPQIISNCVIKEIADEDIKRKIKKEYNYTHYQNRLWMVQGAVWYKEQLKKQQ